MAEPVNYCRCGWAAGTNTDCLDCVWHEPKPPTPHVSFSYMPRTVTYRNASHAAGGGECSPSPTLRTPTGCAHTRRVRDWRVRRG